MGETSSPTVLRDLELVEVSLVPREEAFEGCVVTSFEDDPETWDRIQNGELEGFSIAPDGEE